MRKELEKTFTYRVILLGASGTGKTTFINKLGEKYSKDTASVSVEFQV